jgi:hypothetical protein
MRPKHVDLQNYPNMVRVFHIARSLTSLTIPDLVEKIMREDMREPFARVSTAPTVVVVEKPETKNDAIVKAQQAGFSGRRQGMSTEWDRTYDLDSKPVDMNELKAMVANEVEINTAMSAIVARIRLYRGNYHSQTQRRQEQLFDVFNKFKDQVKTLADVEKMKNTIDTHIAKFEDSKVNI